ncbi:UNC-like C-terminal-domain-containing protein, partial [Mycotypha africana]|uniref:UNC-like C-terminal-domain-containing protein n=1 Tax=Mycotypha africana TaxID=64632 RepID=UPI002300DF50
QQMVDSLDGGFGDDFGAMFEGLIGVSSGKERKEPNVYAERDYIAPSPSGDEPPPSDSKSSKKDKKLFNDARVKSLKERFNYASTDCAATVRKANKQAKGAQSILYESKDQYLLNKCSAAKFVIINLCEQIVVDTIVMANFEFFSSTFKDFKVYASSKYPTDEWHLLGQWQARNTRDLQVFRVPESGFVEYIKIEFLTHYGHEYYCPLSLVRVHGMSMMEYYTFVESRDQDPVWEGEHLWPAEVREQIIQPQFDITNTSETFPIKSEHDEEDAKIIIPPLAYEYEDDTTMAESETQLTEAENFFSSVQKTTDDLSQTYRTQKKENVVPAEGILSYASNAMEPSISHLPLLDNNEMDITTNIADAIVPMTSTSTTIPAVSQQQPATATASPSAISLPTKPNTHFKEGNTQESIYKTIMKRLNQLELNMTLSQRYLEDQNQILNDVFLEMERKHQEQLIILIGHLNETASFKIESMVS